MTKKSQSCMISTDLIEEIIKDYCQVCILTFFRCLSQPTFIASYCNQSMFVQWRNFTKYSLLLHHESRANLGTHLFLCFFFFFWCCVIVWKGCALCLTLYLCTLHAWAPLPFIQTSQTVLCVLRGAPPSAHSPPGPSQGIPNHFRTHL